MSFTQDYVKTADGLTLAVRVYGSRQNHAGRPLICLAGLTRNARDFHRLAERLSDDSKAPRLILAVDSRGRGLSDRDPDPSRYTVPVEAGDVLAVMDAFGIAQADFIGTSRGGLILHVLASMASDRLGSLVLNDIGPVIALEGMRHIQAYLDPDPGPKARREVIAALRLVHGAAFPALSPADWEEMADCLYRPVEQGSSAQAPAPPAGLMIPDFDPAIAAAVRAMDLSGPLPDLWPLFDLLRDRRILVVRGENSTLLSEATLEQMRRTHQSLHVAIARGQGHAPLLHLGELPQAISDFLQR